MAGRKPDFILKCLNKRTNARNDKLGVAWSNPEGNISLILDPCVCLTYDPDMVYTLFPNDRPPSGEEEAFQGFPR